MNRVREQVWEGLLEFLRLITLYVISFLLTEGVVNFIILWIAGSKLTLEQSLLVATFLTGLLKAVDKFMHKQGVVDDNEQLTLGLTRF